MNERERIEKLTLEIERKNEENEKASALLREEISSLSPTLWIDEATNLVRKKSAIERMGKPCL